MNLDEYVKTVGDYADQRTKAARLADTNSLAPAMAMADMYESKDWVEDGLARVPLPKHSKSNRAMKPDTIERFHKWTNALLERDGRPGRFEAATTTMSHIQAGRTARHIPKLVRDQFRTVKQVKPLGVLLTAGYLDQIGVAAELAVREAGGSAPSSDVVQRAARLVKHNAEQGRSGLGAHKIDRLRAKRVRAEIAVIEFLDLAAKVKAKDKDTAIEQLAEFRDFLKAELSRRVR